MIKLFKVVYYYSYSEYYKKNGKIEKDPKGQPGYNCFAIFISCYIGLFASIVMLQAMPECYFLIPKFLLNRHNTHLLPITVIYVYAPAYWLFRKYRPIIMEYTPRVLDAKREKKFRRISNWLIWTSIPMMIILPFIVGFLFGLIQKFLN